MTYGTFTYGSSEYGGTTAIIVGKIDISSTPPGAEIYIDNVLQIDVTPIIITGIPVGPHDIRLTLAGYQDWTDTVTVLENQITIVSINLVQLVAIITAISIDISPNQCIQPCTITATVVWQNIGNSQGSFDPAIVITRSSNGTMAHINLGSTIILEPGQFTTQILFTIPDLVKDTYAICPDPN